MNKLPQEKQKSHIRNRMRRRRQAISKHAQRHAALKVNAQLSKLPEYARAQNIAAYIPSDGEIETHSIFRTAWKKGKHIFVPVVKQKGKMAFRKIHCVSTLSRNRYGIPEPQTSVEISPKRLDLVLLPLVAFDKTGRRLGMGGGYYDRAFAFKNKLPVTKPLLIGLAHTCQQTAILPHQAWDVALDGIITPEQLILLGK